MYSSKNNSIEQAKSRLGIKGSSSEVFPGDGGSIAFGTRTKPKGSEPPFEIPDGEKINTLELH